MVGKTVGALAQIKAILLNHIIVLYNICHHVLKVKKKKKPVWLKNVLHETIKIICFTKFKLLSTFLLNILWDQKERPH